MSNIAGKEDVGENSGGEDEEHNRVIACEYKLNIPRNTSEERFATWTESLGFESFNERVLCSYTPEEEGRYHSTTAEMAEGTGMGTGSRSRSRTITRKSNWLEMSTFPPLLSTLNKNGRSRFDFIKMRDNGRLQMAMVKSERPQVVALQTPPMRKKKRLKMLLLKTDDNAEAENQHHFHDDADDLDNDDQVGDDPDDNQDQKEEERLQSTVGDGAPHQVRCNLLGCLHSTKF